MAPDIIRRPSRAGLDPPLDQIFGMHNPSLFRMVGMHHECVATTIRLMAGQDPPYELTSSAQS
jgi:hypothetical protein